MSVHKGGFKLKIVLNCVNANSKCVLIVQEVNVCVYEAKTWQC